MDLAMVALTETYHDVKGLLHDVVWKFQRRYGGDRDELFAEANRCFLDSYADYNRDCADCFSTWLTRKIWWGLLDRLRQEARRKERFSFLPQGENEIGLMQIADRQRFNLDEFLNELSEDAKLVALLAIQPPADIRLAMKSRRSPLTNSYAKVLKPDKFGRQRNRSARWRREIVEFLKDLGWASYRIAETFSEIQEALI